jgi:Ti-type conjugative transfer relaxase TraA
MLSIGKVGGGDADPRYYLDTVASGAEDYYTGRGEAPGQWAGRGAGAQGLSGTVEDEPFIAQLTAHPGNGKKVLAYDLTFSAPKSVSVLYGIGDERTSRAARDAHDHAVQEALGYLERDACWTRRGAAGRDVIQGDGLTVALFRHRTSRAGDPQLHTHSVIVNATEADGRVTALDGRALYTHGKTAGYLYEAALREQLTRDLGVEWLPVENGMAEIAGIDSDVLRHFSQRRQEILEHMAKHGGRSARSAQIAALETRRAKEYNVPSSRLRDEWRARASEMGLGQAELDAVLDRRAAGRPAPRNRDALDEELQADDGITRQASTFDRRDVLREIAAAHRQGATVADIEALAERWLRTSDVVRLEEGHQRAHLGGPRHSTRDMVELERGIVRDAAARRNTGVAVVPRTQVNQALADAPDLAAEQAELVQRITESGDGVEIVRAAAGTGKTRALSEARDAWATVGTPVYGCALAARAAVELESSAGIDSTTIARFLQDVDHGHGLRPGSVLVVDEAGMVGSRTIDRLARHAAETDSKLLLVGDDRQLPEIDAGGAFRGLADRLGAVELKTVRRQALDWDREALAKLRVGKVRAWADAYRDRGRIVAHPTAEDTRAGLVDDWWEAARTGDHDAVMIAHRRADVDELNRLARARMHRDGLLGPDELVTPDGRPFAVGDHVLARRNDRRAGVVNGTRGRVVDVDVETRSVTIQPAGGDPRTVDGRYLDEGWLDHGYALTAHAAQGATVDRSFVLGSDDLYREWGYTALSRHRRDARFYVVSPGSSERALPGLEPDPDPLTQDLGGMLGPSRRKDLALDVANPRFLAAAHRTKAEPPSESNRDGHRDVANEEIEAAQARVEALTAERDALGVWQRSKRKEIDALLDRQREAINRWEAERSAGAVREPAPPRPVERASDPAVTMSVDELRAALLRPTVEVEARIGPRTDTLSERESWCRAAANLVGRGDLPPAPTVDIEALADIGPEL